MSDKMKFSNVWSYLKKVVMDEKTKTVGPIHIYNSLCTDKESYYKGWSKFFGQKSFTFVKYANSPRNFPFNIVNMLLKSQGFINHNTQKFSGIFPFDFHAIHNKLLFQVYFCSPSMKYDEVSFFSNLMTVCLLWASLLLYLFQYSWI